MRKIKNKIEGVKPFNEFKFKSCYYHQLIAGLSCLGISRDAVLLSDIESPGKNFSVCHDKGLSERSSERFFGYRCKPCNITQEILIKNIDKGRPMIVGVDCFYLESRTDTYQMKHLPHFILVYGYDLETDEANVVDHDYENSYIYKEKKISLNNLLEANKYYRKRGKKGIYTGRVLYKKQAKTNGGDFIKFDKKRIAFWRKNSEENLWELKRLFDGEGTALKKKASLITEYLGKMRWRFLLFSSLEDLQKDETNDRTSRNLFQGYSNLLSLFWKMTQQNNFEYANRHLEAICRKIDFVIKTEKRFYDLLSRCRNEKI